MFLNCVYQADAEIDLRRMFKLFDNWKRLKSYKKLKEYKPLKA